MPQVWPELAAGHGYPRPQLRRAQWQSLNGPWEFAFDVAGRWIHPAEVGFDRIIEVPYAPETPASGVHATGAFRACWYRRRISAPRHAAGHHLRLHFGAVDWAATVWVNGARVAYHEGGYTPFSVDLTQVAPGGPEYEIVVLAQDDPLDLRMPRGKQTWQATPGSIWYPRTSGIWQTVWLEPVPTAWIERLQWTPDLERWELGLEAWLAGEVRDDLRLGVELRAGQQLLARDTYHVLSGEVHRRIALSDPGVDDYRNALLWNPDRPTILQARLRLWSENGDVDEVESYTALRAIGLEDSHIVLNGRPYLMRLVLDQGYWPETGLTAPDDAALRRDVELAKAMGFNGVRKHQKIEDPRYLYWADHLGLLVWAEMPSAYRFTHLTIERLTREWMEVVERDLSHPCIVAWVPFNESWGVPNLPHSAAQRNWVRALYHLTKTLDPSRPVIGNDGWESVATDIIGIHDYDAPDRLAQRYQTADSRPRVFERERPAGRALVLETRETPGHPVVLSEFGGIALAEDENGTWGYWRTHTPEGLAAAYTRLLSAVHAAGLFAGFCYTQFTDTYQEANGLLYFNRQPKVPLDIIAAATRGHPHPVPGPSDVQADAPEA